MKILIGVDDSPCSSAALQLVRKLKWPVETKVVVISAVNPVMAHAEMYVSAGTAAETIVTEQSNAQVELVSRAEAELHDAGLMTQGRVLYGDPREAIVQAAKDEGADLVVVGSHGRSGVPNLLMGSVASHVITHAPCSVLVAKTNGGHHVFTSPDRLGRREGQSCQSGHAAPRTDTMRVLIGVDESPYSDAAVQFVRKLPLPAGTRVTIVSAVQPVVPLHAEIYISTAAIADQLIERQTKAHQELVSKAEREVSDMGFATKARVLMGDPREAILQAAKDEAADLVVVGSHGRRGFAKLVMGSVASYVVTHARCSVLVVKTAGGRA